MEYKDLILDKQGSIAYITLNRPEKLNTLSQNIQQEFNDALLDIWQDDNIRVFVIKGSGRCFCAGFDVSEPGIDTLGQTDLGELSDDTDTGIRQNRRNEPWARYAHVQLRRVNWRNNLWHNPKISIAQVHSYCLGAGLMVAAHCDLLVCSEDTLFAYPPIRYGSSVIFSILPPWFLGVRKLKEMAFTGNMIDSHDAYNCGLVNRVMPMNKLETEVNRIARVAANVPYPANMLSKLAINNYVDTFLGRDMGTKWAQSLNQMMEGSSVPGNIWTYISEEAASRGGASSMFSEIRDKFLEGDELARKNAEIFSQETE